MLIALDYDGTYDAAPDLWDQFIANAEPLHEVIIVTYRDERYDMTDMLRDLKTRTSVYFTRGIAKAFWMEQFAPTRHAYPKVWIDDRPKTVNTNSGFNREELAQWRTEQKGMIAS